MPEPSLEELLTRIRSRIISRGSIGIQGLGRVFRIADDNGDRKIDLQREFPKLLEDMGVLLNRAELQRLSQLMDRNGDGQIDYDEFVRYLGPPLNGARLKAVEECFRLLDADGSGAIDVSDVALRNPRLSRSSCDSVHENLLSSFNRNGDRTISLEEFVDYYREVSPNFQSDEQFIQTLFQSWGLKF